MKKYVIFGICCLAMDFLTVSIFAQGFIGPSVIGTYNDSQVQYQPVNVNQVQALPHNSQIILTGNIVQSVGREYYTFRDSSGELVVEIERKRWLGLTFSPSDRVELLAKLERKRDGSLEIEVSGIRKL
jgi:uncharacterized protein (TIGR00156 family)